MVGLFLNDDPQGMRKEIVMT